MIWRDCTLDLRNLTKRRINEDFALYALHDDQVTERYRKTLVGHLVQLARTKKVTSAEDAHSLLVHMFIYSNDFDSVRLIFSRTMYRLWCFC